MDLQTIDTFFYGMGVFVTCYGAADYLQMRRTSSLRDRFMGYKQEDEEIFPEKVIAIGLLSYEIKRSYENLYKMEGGVPFRRINLDNL